MPEGDAQVEPVEEREVAHEVFAFHVPHGADRPERRVAVLRVVGDQVRGVGAQAGRQGVLVVEGVRGVEVHREVLRIRFGERRRIGEIGRILVGVSVDVGRGAAEREREGARGERLVVVSEHAGIDRVGGMELAELESGDGIDDVASESTCEGELVAHHIVPVVALFPVEQPAFGIGDGAYRPGGWIVGRVEVDQVLYLESLLAVKVPDLGVGDSDLERGDEVQAFEQFEGESSTQARVEVCGGQFAVADILQGVVEPVGVGELVEGQALNRRQVVFVHEPCIGAVLVDQPFVG